ncbi:MAG: aminopeptidase P family protein [Thermoplasmata archaeon]|nr:aminopeptidase P family protein [Thermoplasmata archaeon]
MANWPTGRRADQLPKNKNYLSQKTILTATYQVVFMDYYTKRWNRIKRHLKREKYDAFVVKQDSNMRYLSYTHLSPAHPPSPIVSYIVIPKKGSLVAITPSLEYFRCQVDCAVKDIRLFTPYPGMKADAKDGKKLLKNVLDEKKCKKVLFDTKENVKDIKTESDDLITKMREVKDDQELRNIRKACRIVDKSAKVLGDEILKIGKTEREVARELDFFMLENGAHSIAFSSIIASGKHSSFSHHDNGTRKLRDGDLVICDFGVYFNGYCSDITRTYGIGNVKEKLIEIYDIVLEAQTKAIKMVKPRVEYKTVDMMIRNLFKEYGYQGNFVHGTGHGIGLDVHESPRVACVAKGKFAKGNVVTVEPGIYIPNKGGVRIEDDVNVTSKGVEVLTKAYKKSL